MFCTLDYTEPEMIIDSDSNKENNPNIQRGVGANRTLWPVDSNGFLRIPYRIDSSSKFVFYETQFWNANRK